MRRSLCGTVDSHVSSPELQAPQPAARRTRTRLSSFSLAFGIAAGLAVLMLGITTASTHRLIIVLTRHDGVVVRHHPWSDAKPITTLPAESQLLLLRTTHSWSEVRVWGTITGWAQSHDLTRGKPWTSTSHYVPPALPPTIDLSVGPQHVHIAALAETAIPAYVVPGGASAGTAVPGKPLTITEWEQDRSGMIWYRVHRGWIVSGHVRFVLPRRAATLARPVSGKGMWLTQGTVAESDPNSLVTAARRIGLTHLYVEFADSPLGLYGTEGLARLLRVAHLHHIAIIAWVYPYLRSVAADVELTRQVAAYETGRQRFDGVALDIEDNIHARNVRAYAQLVRAYLGPHALIVGVVWDPQAMPSYPFRSVAESADVLAPMDYWHDRRGKTGWAYPTMPYGGTYAYRFARDSVLRIRNEVGRGGPPIAPIGQMFDNFNRDELGPDAPTAAEINGFLRGCRAARAWGVSFFQWMTATPQEWDAFQAWKPQ